MAKGRPIYPEEEARMVRLWQEGKMYEEIGVKVGRSAAVARHAIDRVRRREKAHGVILEQKDITRTCAYCGKDFYCPPGSSKKYCCVKCGQAAWRQMKGVRVRNARAEDELLGPSMPYKMPPLVDGVNPTHEEIAIKTDRERSKWGAIAKKCAALGMSYGEASARGLL